MCFVGVFDGSALFPKSRDNLTSLCTEIMWHYLTVFKREAKIDALDHISWTLVRMWMFLIELLRFRYINCMFWKCAEMIWPRQFPRVMKALRNSAFATNNSLASPLSVSVLTWQCQTECNKKKKTKKKKTTACSQNQSHASPVFVRTVRCDKHQRSKQLWVILKAIGLRNMDILSRPKLSWRMCASVAYGKFLPWCLGTVIVTFWDSSWSVLHKAGFSFY